jgi:hypothetical protein
VQDEIRRQLPGLQRLHERRVVEKRDAGDGGEIRPFGFGDRMIDGQQFRHRMTPGEALQQLAPDETGRPGDDNPNG